MLRRGELGGGGAEQEDRGVEEQDAGKDDGAPGVDPLVVGAPVAGGFAEQKGADEGGEEHEDAAERDEETDAGLGEALAGTAGMRAPVVAVSFSVAAGSLVGWRTAAVAVIAFLGRTVAAVNVRRWESGRHGRQSVDGRA